MIIKSDYIRDRLSFIESKVKNDTKQKLYDINKTAEDIFMHLLNDVYGWQLVNANDIKSNFPAIDLIDTHNEIVIQVTSSMDDSKVVRTIEKFAKFADDSYKDGAYKQYADYDLKMFYIKEKPDKFSKATETKIENQGMSDDDFLGIEDINTKVSANPNIAQKVFKTLCKLLHDKACESDIHKQLTTKLGKSTLIGREKELQEIDERLKTSKTLLVKGIGGVGKSTIASNYLHRHKDEYNYYGFFEGLESFESQLELAFKLEVEQGQDRIDRVLRELIKLEPDANKLLVIDDVKEIKENKEKLEKILGLEHNGYRVLLTSREEIEDVKQYDLDVLSMVDAKELFNSIYKVEDEVLLEEILEYLDSHAFFIEKTAHSIKKTLTPEMIKDKFKNGEFSKISVKRKESFNKFLNELFTFDGLDDEEILMLKQFSALPSIGIDFESLEYVFQKKEDSEFEELLYFLSEKGWLIKLGGGYKLHQIIKEYLLYNHTSSFNEIEVILDSLYMTIENSEDAKIALDNQDKIIFFESLGTLINRLEIENMKIGIFFNNFGNIYRYLGFYKKAEILHLKALQISEKILGKEHLDTSIFYNNLASLYQLMGKYEQVESLYLKALKISESVLGKEDIGTAISYGNLALFYKSIKSYQKAELFYIKALKIQKNTFGYWHKDLATTYNNLAVLYKSMGDFQRAEKFYLNSLEIREKLLGKKHPTIAGSYHNLGVFYYLEKNYRQAYNYAKRAFDIWSKFLPDEHPDLVDSKKGLKLIETSLNQESFNFIKIKRNDPCPCNSGKKYKRCCGKNS